MACIYLKLSWNFQLLCRDCRVVCLLFGILFSSLPTMYMISISACLCYDRILSFLQFLCLFISGCNWSRKDMHCSSARPLMQHCNAPASVTQITGLLQQKRKNYYLTLSLCNQFYPFSFFLLSSSLALSPSHFQFSLFLMFLFCSSDGSEIIRLPSWLDTDSMGRFDLDFLL